MESKKSSAAYYSLVFLFGFTSVMALIIWLQWPLTAGMVLGACILFQFMYLSKKVFETWKKAVENNMTFDIFSAIKAGFSLAESNTETEV